MENFHLTHMFRPLPVNCGAPAVAAALGKWYRDLVDADIIALFNARLDHARLLIEPPEKPLVFESEPDLLGISPGQEETGRTSHYLEPRVSSHSENTPPIGDATSTGDHAGPQLVHNLGGSTSAEGKRSLRLSEVLVT